jgi:hypothetical protein
MPEKMLEPTRVGAAIGTAAAIHASVSRAAVWSLDGVAGLNRFPCRKVFGKISCKGFNLA